MAVADGDRIGFIAEGDKVPIVYTTDPTAPGSVCVNIERRGNQYPAVGAVLAPRSTKIDTYKWSLAAEVELGEC